MEAVAGYRLVVAVLVAVLVAVVNNSMVVMVATVAEWVVMVATVVGLIRMG